MRPTNNTTTLLLMTKPSRSPVCVFAKVPVRFEALPFRAAACAWEICLGCAAVCAVRTSRRLSAWSLFCVVWAARAGCLCARRCAPGAAVRNRCRQQAQGKRAQILCPHRPRLKPASAILVSSALPPGYRFATSWGQVYALPSHAPSTTSALIRQNRRSTDAPRCDGHGANVQNWPADTAAPQHLYLAYRAGLELSGVIPRITTSVMQRVEPCPAPWL